MTPPMHQIDCQGEIDAVTKSYLVIANQSAGWCGDRRKCLWCNPSPLSREIYTQYYGSVSHFIAKEFCYEDQY